MILSEEKAIAYWMDYLTGELSSDHEEELMNYLSLNPELERELKADQIVWSRMAEMPSPEPSDRMDARFDAMLAGYKSANERNAAINWWPVAQEWFSRSWRVGLASLILGLGLGWVLLPSTTQKTELSELSDEMAEMKKMMMLTLIEQPSAQQRLHAVSLTDEIPTADLKVIDVLAKTLNTDPNINVRLAALESLTGYWNLPDARAALVRSIADQDSPLVQSAIADAMVALREKNAIDEFEKLLGQPDLNEGIKMKIETAIEKLEMI